MNPTLNNTIELFRLSLLEYLMVDYSQLILIEMETASERRLDLNDNDQDQVLKISNKLAKVDTSSIIKFKSCISLGQYFTSNEPGYPTEYFGYLNQANEDRYWMKVIDSLEVQARKPTLVYLNPDIGLNISSTGTRDTGSNEHLGLHQLFNIKSKLDGDGTLAYFQNLNEIEIELESYYHQLKLLFGKCVVFTGSARLNFGIVILPSIDQSEKVIASIIRFYEEHDLEQGKEVFLFS